MTDRIEPTDDLRLDQAIGHLLRLKAERAANGADPFELVLARVATQATPINRRLLIVGAFGVMVVVALGLAGYLGSQSRVGASPSPAPSAAGIAPFRRPLQIPALTAGGACPVTPVGLTLERLDAFQGAGPVRVNNLNEVPITELPLQNGWYGQKVFWAVDAREPGPILVRVARIGGSGGIGLGLDNTTELVLSNNFGGDTVVGPAPSFPIARIFIDGVSFREPGCYFMQMDGPATTSTVVFRALIAPATPGASGPSLPPGGISEAAAVTAARDHVPPDAVFVSARAGPFGTVNPPEGNGRLGSGFPVKPSDLVWALTYSETIIICPPSPGASCLPPRAASYTVIIDYRTGAFRSSSAFAPAP